ncbi:MAG TPA: RDD family protein, partial [Leptospiraceae bacterium]|nr:RDD family protein [Leptospiraceae bacterium]
STAQALAYGALAIAYQAAFEALVGWTPGKRLLGLRVVYGSGSRLTWEWIWDNVYGKKYRDITCMTTGKKLNRNSAPWLVDYTEDRDLWRWSLPRSREITTGLRSHPLRSHSTRAGNCCCWKTGSERMHGWNWNPRDH